MESPISNSFREDPSYGPAEGDDTGTPEHPHGIYLVFSDVQGSFEYLDRFFRATQKMRKDGYICLGDIVDKLAKFTDNRCITAVRENASYCVRGNHEDNKPPAAAKISPENISYIETLPPVLQKGNLLLFHSSLREEGKRLESEDEIRKEAGHIMANYPDVNMAFFGHTHRRGAYTASRDSFRQLAGEKVRLDPGSLNMVNPGGIGVRHGLEKTFARADLDSLEISFFTLEETEKMSRMADLADAFDSRWMPALNADSCGWFLAYARNDCPALKAEGGPVKEFAEKLGSFDTGIESRGARRKKEYIDSYSLELAEMLERLTANARRFFNTKSPIQSRSEYMGLKREKYP